MAVASAVGAERRGMSREERKVIFASSLGTVFEWYDFYLYGSLAAFIGANFFTPYPEATRNFCRAARLRRRLPGPPVRRAGLRPDRRSRRPQIHLPRDDHGHGPLDLPGRPVARRFASIGIAAPVILVALRMLQGLALGGEYGGAATYVAEHAPDDKRGY